MSSAPHVKIALFVAVQGEAGDVEAKPQPSEEALDIAAHRQVFAVTAQSACADLEPDTAPTSTAQAAA